MLRGQAHEHRRHAVRSLHSVCVLDRDGHRCHERRLGQLVACLQVGPQSARADGEHHVVDGRPHRRSSVVFTSSKEMEAKATLR